MMPAVADKATLADFAYARISEALVSGRYGPGEKLTLRGLSAELQISSTPIRDAIRHLAAGKAIDFIPNRHIRVPILTGAELLELRDIRLALEPLAVQMAAERMRDETMARLRRIDTAIRAARAAGQVPVELIQTLHFTLYREAGRDHLVEMIRSLWLRTAPYVRLLFPDYSQRERGTLRGMVLDALERRDGRAAAAFMAADIGGALDFIIAAVEAGALEREGP
jgi:DNA-binding GntR family transcriptional regulator